MTTYDFDTLNLIQSSGDATVSYDLDVPSTMPETATRIEVPNIRIKTTPSEILTDSESPAVLYVEDNDGKVVALSNRFYLTGVQESQQERAQIIETFGTPAYFFYGERTKVYNFSGHVLDAKSTNVTYSYKNQWSIALSVMYDNYLRGTKLAESKSEAVLIFKNVRLRGFILNLNIVRSSSNPNSNAFSFSMLVNSQEYLGNLGETTKDLYDVANFVIGGDKLNSLKEYSKQIDTLSEAPANNKDAFASEILNSIPQDDEVNRYLLGAIGPTLIIDNIETFIKSAPKEAYTQDEYLSAAGLGDLHQNTINVINSAITAAEGNKGYLENRAKYYYAVAQYNNIIKNASADAKLKSELFT